jgi:hypothetical protein
MWITETVYWCHKAVLVVGFLDYGDNLTDKRSSGTFERLWQAIIAKVWVVSQRIFFAKTPDPILLTGWLQRCR